MCNGAIMSAKNTLEYRMEGPKFSQNCSCKKSYYSGQIWGEWLIGHTRSSWEHDLQKSS